MMTRGIIYGLTGPSHAELLVVSLWSLRQHYDGPICVFATDDSRQIVERIATDGRLQFRIARTERLDDCPRPHWVTKSMMYLQTPFDQTIYLDCDTIIKDAITPLFADGLTFAVTRSRGVDIRLMDDHPYPISLWRQVRRFRRYGPAMKEMIRQAKRHNGYAANNGVLAFAKHHPALYEIHHLSVGFRQARMHDEIATQMVLPRYADDIRYVGGRWNAITKYEDAWDNAIIAHVHHSTHLRAFKTWGAERGMILWREHLLRAIYAKAGEINQWVGQYDPAVKKLLDDIGGGE